MRVLVLDGNENQAVACVRSLARAGYRPVVGAETSWSKAGWSRAAAGGFTYPSPRSDAPGFVRAVAAAAAEEPGTLVLPMTERSTLPLSACRDTLLAAGARLALPPHATLLRAFDKSETHRLASELGVAVPRTIQAGPSDSAASIAEVLALPVVLKPQSSEEVTASGATVATGAPIYARSAAELARALDTLRRRSSRVLVQEFVEGHGAGYFALMCRGGLRAEFAHRRIRDVRPTGSGSSVRESVRPEPSVRRAALAILEALEWHGVAMVEFRVRPDGTPVFLEVNGRFWNSLALAVYAGADFPALLARMAEHGDVEPRLDYRVGVRCRWLLGDLRHLAAVMLGPPAGFPGRFPGRLRTLRDFLVPVPGTFHDNFELRDPLPELGDWLDFGMRRIPAALRKAR